MSKRFQLLLILSILVSSSTWAEEERATAVTPHGISPVYEQMLAHQVFIRWKELNQKSDLKQEEPFLIVGWGEKESTLAKGIVSSLKERHGTAADWQYNGHIPGLFRPRHEILAGPRNDVIPPPVLSAKGGSGDASRHQTGGGIIASEAKQSPASNPFRGVILMKADTKDLREAASYIGRAENKGFLIVFAKEPIGRVWLESIFEKAGLEIQTVISAPELEFVKDEKGRQVVDLNFPYYQNLIYERLVREGMNPVHAQPAAIDAIKNFRVTYTPKVIIVGKSQPVASVPLPEVWYEEIVNRR